MKDFGKQLQKEILKQILDTEVPKIKKVIKYVSEHAQADFVNQTNTLIDLYYEGYEPASYVRTEQYRKKQPRDEKGKFSTKQEDTRRRANDISLREAIKAKGEPGVGLCRSIDGSKFGYEAGVIFDPEYFDTAMKHSIRGIEEWDIVSNFLYSNSDGVGNLPQMQRSPEAATILDGFWANYDSTFDKHYNDAYKKFK